jgi:hypothetical protein
MKADATAPRTRFTVDLSDYPDLVAIYLVTAYGMKPISSVAGWKPSTVMSRCR